MVAVALMAMVLAFAGVIFRVSIDSYRTAGANTEIMQKLRAITDQLNADFKNLRKDGEIFVIWDAKGVRDDDGDNIIDRYDRFDRIMFFANGDFQSYNEWLVGGNEEVLRGNIARICYTLANKPSAGIPKRPKDQPEAERILARTQHILTQEPLDPCIDVNTFTFPVDEMEEAFYQWNNVCEYDKTTLQQWKNISWNNKARMLAFINGVDIVGNRYDTSGVTFDLNDANSIHTLLCQGVSNFTIQSWYDKQKRWIPEVDPNCDGSLAGSDFYTYKDDSGTVVLDTDSLPGVLYPYREPPLGDPYGTVSINLRGDKGFTYPSGRLDKAHFNEIPGLGRAFKFTFTLFDSKGIIEGGRTFTHIVYLDK
jgi:hypothetical protein